MARASEPYPAQSPLFLYGGHHAYQHWPTSYDALYSKNSVGGGGGGGGCCWPSSRRCGAESSVERILRSRTELLAALRECEGNALVSEGPLPRKEISGDIIRASSGVKEDNIDERDTDPKTTYQKGEMDEGHCPSPASGAFIGERQDAGTAPAEQSMDVTSPSRWRLGEESAKTQFMDEYTGCDEEKCHSESENAGEEEDTIATRPRRWSHGKCEAGTTLQETPKATIAEGVVFGSEPTRLVSVEENPESVGQQRDCEERMETFEKARTIEKSGGEDVASGSPSEQHCCERINRDSAPVMKSNEAVREVQYGNTGIWEHGCGEGKRLRVLFFVILKVHTRYSRGSAPL